MKKCILVILLLLLTAPSIHAEVLFSDDFDAYTWNVDNSKDGTECGGSSHPCSGGNIPPTDWSAYRAMTSTSGGGYVGSLPSSQVDHTLGTTSGHAFIALYGGTPNTSDNDISKYLGAEYAELWVSFYIRSSGETSVTGAGDKTFRVLNLETACDNYNEFFSGGCGAPIFVYNHTGSSSGTGTWKGSFRCDPQASNYYCNTDYDTNDTQAWSPSGIGWKDGNWHKLKFYLKMNTAAGASDGIARVYIDNTQVMNKTNIEWRESGTNASGWNYISIGGNTPEGTSPEEWQAFDDLIVATTEAEVDGEAETSVGISGGSGAGCVIK